jgi:hypothetical protein
MNNPLKKVTTDKSKKQLIVLGGIAAGTIIGAGLGNVSKPVKLIGAAALLVAGQVTNKALMTQLGVGVLVSPAALKPVGYVGGIEGLKEQAEDMISGSRNHAAMLLGEMYVPDSITSVVAGSGSVGGFDDYRFDDSDDDDISGYLDDDFDDDDFEDEGVGAITTEAMMLNGSASGVNALTQEAMMLAKMGM